MWGFVMWQGAPLGTVSRDMSVGRGGRGGRGLLKREREEEIEKRGNTWSAPFAEYSTIFHLPVSTNLHTIRTPVLPPMNHAARHLQFKSCCIFISAQD